MSGEETRDHFGLKSDIIRIRVGKYICETKNSAGRYYRSNKGHVKGRCSSFSSWFQCRLPGLCASTLGGLPWLICGWRAVRTRAPRGSLRGMEFALPQYRLFEG